jgi:3-hydroxyisobutyrate dehydrogenase-like beta-hydroxyacid dehydrogenase
MATTKRITVLGLGQMGIKLAQLLVEARQSVSVWNRTTSKASSLSSVSIHEEPVTAIAASPLTVLCVYDYQAVKDIFYGLQNKEVLAGKTIVNFTTGSPKEADELETWLKTHGAHYLNGALQAAPDQMGLADTTILLAGDPVVYGQHQDTLAIFGGNVKYLGAKALLASAMDLATLSWLYGSYLGMLHGVGLCQQSGLGLDAFRDILGEITPGFTAFFKHQIDVIKRGDFTVSQSPLAISVSATQRIRQAAEAYRLNTAFLSVISQFLETADRQGLGNQEVASLIRVINPQPVYS